MVALCFGPSVFFILFIMVPLIFLFSVVYDLSSLYFVASIIRKHSFYPNAEEKKTLFSPYLGNKEMKTL